ncbi:MAG: hypothetical protein RLZZ241_322 [Bacteroidota bacterium]|jgi:DNA-binding XRE family transcriptional regulator
MDSIIIRLEELLAHYDLSASAFAEAIGVQRSSISHLMSGRNKPSLEFVLKVISKFPEVDLYWLLLGLGEIKKQSFTETQQIPNLTNEDNIVAPDLPLAAPTHQKLFSNESDAERIVFFFKNGTFKTYTPQ